MLESHVDDKKGKHFRCSKMNEINQFNVKVDLSSLHDSFYKVMGYAIRNTQWNHCLDKEDWEVISKGKLEINSFIYKVHVISKNLRMELCIWKRGIVAEDNWN